MSEAQTAVVGDVQSVTMGVQPTGMEAPPAAAPTTPEARPEWLPEEFSSVDQFVAAYKELKGATAPEAPPQEAPPADTEEQTDYVVEIVEGAGLDWDTVSGHYAEHGTLADEHYAAFENAGIPRVLVDNYLAGQQALLMQFRNTVLSAAGGEESFKAAAAWAAAGNLSEAELAAYNAAVESGDVETAKLAVQGLIARYARSQGSEPNLADGKGGRAMSPGYESRAQMVADMQNPLYEKDPAFRAEVERKILASPNLF